MQKLQSIPLYWWTEKKLIQWNENIDYFLMESTKFLFEVMKIFIWI